MENSSEPPNRSRGIDAATRDFGDDWLWASFGWPDTACTAASRSFARAAGGSAPVTGRRLFELVQFAPPIELSDLQRADDVGADRFSLGWITPIGQPRIRFVGSLIFQREGQVTTALQLLLHRADRVPAGERDTVIERLSAFMAAGDEGIAFHIDGVITDVSPSLLRMLGYTADEMIGRRTTDFVPPDQHAQVLDAIASGHDVAYESLAIAASGRTVPVEYRAGAITWQGREQRVIIVRDLRERREAEERMRHLAVHDALTGLPNRAHLDAVLAHRTQPDVAQQSPFAVIFLDLDHLKRINDSLGHHVGDQLLISVADRLANFCMLEADAHGPSWIARLGGDEFVILLDYINKDQLLHFCDRLHRTLRSPTALSGHGSVRVTASIGVAVFPDHGHTAADLLRNADLAMYVAKSAGRGATNLFVPTLASDAEQAMKLEADVVHAQRNNELELHFQPLFSTSEGRLQGVEALLRWRHPVRGLLAPLQFLDIIERLLMLDAISAWVLDQALAAVRRWRKLGWHDARVAVNLSRPQVRAPDFERQVFDALKRHDLPGSALEVEVTERLLQQDEDILQGSLSALRAHGVRVAIDDFGTGYSALARLRQFPIDRLKIDRSFVSPMPDDTGASRLVSSLLHLAKSMDLISTAEGVETEAQLRLLRRLGCDQVQGFLLARPMTESAFTERMPMWLGVKPAEAGQT